MISIVEKAALLLAASERMRIAGEGHYPPMRNPVINRNHIDGPYFTALNGTITWLSLWERLLTKIGIWDAWDIEARRFPLPIINGN